MLVGTQMIAKGHDFPRVTLVGVVSADVGLGLADFRASERTFQLLTQVAGRAGRGEQPGEAIVQTLYPDHYSIQLACRQDYPAFYERELQFRTAMRYPPVVSLVNAVVRVAHVRRRDGRCGGCRAEGAGWATAGRCGSWDRRRRRSASCAASIARSCSSRARNRRKMREALQAALAARPELQRRTSSTSIRSASLRSAVVIDAISSSARSAPA